LAGGPYDDSWVKQYKMEDADWEYQYLTSLHWSITQFTPGSMHVQPQNIPERAFAIAVLVMGMIIFSSIVSSITAATGKLKSMNAVYNTQIWMTRKLCKEHQFEKPLIMRIVRYSDNFIKPKMTKVDIKEIKLLRMLPNSMRMEVMLSMWSKYLMPNPFFAKLNELCSQSLPSICDKCLDEDVLDAGEYLFHPGDQAAAMSFVKSGTLLYKVWRCNPNNPEEGEYQQLIIQESSEVNWWAEAVLWTSWTFQGTMMAKRPANLVSVQAEKFGKVMGEFRVEMPFCRLYAKMFVDGMNTLAGFDTESDEDDQNLSDVLAIPEAIQVLEKARGVSGASLRVSASSSIC